MLKQSPQDLIRIDAIGLRMKVQKDAMAQDRNGQRRNVFIGHMVAAPRKRPRLGREHDELRGSHARAVIYIFLDEVRSFILEARRADQLNHIFCKRFSNGHHAHKLLESEDLLGICNSLHFGIASGRRQIHVLQFILGAEVFENHIEEESIELRLG